MTIIETKMCGCKNKDLCNEKEKGQDVEAEIDSIPEENEKSFGRSIFQLHYEVSL